MRKYLAFLPLFLAILSASCLIVFGVPESASAQTTSTTTATVSGKVWDESGVAIPDSSVGIYKADHSVSYNTVTNANGTYSIAVPPDTYKIRAWPLFGITNLISSYPIDITLSAGETRTQDLILLKAAKTIKGQVKRADGTSVTNARVQAFRQDTYIEIQTDSSGNYTLLVTGGAWSVTVFPITTSDWIYNQSPTGLTFASDITAEEKIINFIVTTVEASVKGKILRPDGTPAAMSTSISFQGSAGLGFGSSVDQSGSFFVQLSTGTYSIFIYVSDPGFSAPTTSPVTVVKGEAKDLGILYLVKATKTIKGRVVRSDGRGVGDAVVSASRGTTQGYVEAQADSAGNYSLLVTGGTWNLHVFSRSETRDWAYSRPSPSIVFAENSTPEEKIVDFIVSSIDAKVQGRVLLPDGTAPPLNKIFINLNSSSGDNFGGDTNEQGFFSIGAATGTYNIYISSQDSSVVPPAFLPITLAKGETKDLGTLTLARATKTIKGKVRFPDGNGVGDAGVNAYQEDTRRSVFITADPAGNYTLLTSGGTWRVSISPQSSPAGWSYIQPQPTVIFAGDLTFEEKVVDFTVTVTDARVRGNIYRPDGTPPPENTAWVSLRPKDAYISGMPVYGFGGQVYASGFFDVPVTAGTYELLVETKESNLIAPTLPAIVLAKGEVRDLGNITLVKPPKTVKGIVRYPDGRGVTDAVVGAYTRAGPQREAKTDLQGNYALLLTGGIWEAFIYSATTTPDWVYVASPVFISFANDFTAEFKNIDFTVIKADAKVKGKILRPDGTAPSQGSVSADFQNEAGMSLGGRPTDATGAFAVSLPAGTYRLNIFSKDPALIGPELASFTLAMGETKDLGTIVLIKPTKVIKGRVLREDGRAITNARIGVYRQETQQFLEATTDSSGSYTLLLPGGTWEVSFNPSMSTVDWIYTKPPETVIFAKDSSSEEKILNFTVRTADSFIQGKVLKPDGSIPSSDTVFAGVRTKDGFGTGGPVDASGSFRIPIVAGTYTLFIASQDPSFGPPPLPAVTVASGETKDLGEIRLVLRTDYIKGKVTDKDGKGISGIEVNAVQPEGGGLAFALTNSQGEFDLRVIPGPWEVSARPDPATKLYSLDPPKQITVVSGVTSVVNFVLHLADAKITGQVVDEKGNVVSDVFGFVDVSQEVLRSPRSDFFFGGPGLGGPVERGTFSLAVPAGTYTLSLFLPPDSSYTSGPPQKVTVASGQTLTVKVTVFRNTSKITGNLRDESGKIITGVPAKIFASTETNIWRDAFLDPVSGSYSLGVAPGTWYLGFEIDPAFGYVAAGHDIETKVGENVTVVRDLTAIKANSIITGQISDPVGGGVFHAFVGVSKTSFSGAFEGGTFESMVAEAETDAKGFYKVAVPPGTYFIKTFVPPEFGFISAAEEKVTTAEGQTLTLNLKLRKAEFKITGKVFVNGTTTVAESFIWGWAEQGGYQETVSKSDGSYILNVTGSSTWRVAASKEIGGVLYKASEVPLFVGTTSMVHEINLQKVAVMPPSTLKTADASRPMVVSSAGGGAAVTAPANAISSSGSVSVSITPDERTPSQGDVTVIGIVYDIEARDATGQVISSFRAPVTLSLLYEKTEVAEKGVKEETLDIGFWDETKGTWKPLENCLVNKTENNVICKTTHFTRFAIVAAADIIPPVAPTAVTVSALGQGKVKIEWKNPSRDFDHAKIYRSATTTQLGEIRALEVPGKEFTDDEGLSEGITYYYVVRAVDPAGNESTNTNQVSVKAVGTSAKKMAPAAPLSGEAPKDKLPPGQAIKLEILRNLAVGTTGDDVKAMQELLLKEGVYPEGLITGFFGNLTKQAVVRFQEKYAADILSPVGLAKGSGFIGPSTRKKINELLGMPSKEKSAVPPGQAVKLEILRNLAVGTTGDDVKAMQELLLKEGVYPEGLITGFFGNLTKQAVIRFQEKYADEILTPSGLSQGTGVVGPFTRKKIDKILSK